MGSPSTSPCWRASGRSSRLGSARRRSITRRRWRRSARRCSTASTTPSGRSGTCCRTLPPRNQATRWSTQRALEPYPRPSLSRRFRSFWVHASITWRRETFNWTLTSELGPPAWRVSSARRRRRDHDRSVEVVVGVVHDVRLSPHLHPACQPIAVDPDFHPDRRLGGTREKRRDLGGNAFDFVWAEKRGRNDRLRVPRK